jgi:hypothetical protein
MPYACNGYGSVMRILTTRDIIRLKCANKAFARSVKGKEDLRASPARYSTNTHGKT